MKCDFLLAAYFFYLGNLSSINYSEVRTGAERTEIYIPMLEGKKVAVLANQTSVIGNTHLVDSLLSLGINIVKIFSPEHGFRGDAEAGEEIANCTDDKTGLSVISLYGKKIKPTKEDMKGIDVVVFDIQTVGVRFFTYTTTMHYMMEACAENNVEFMVLDRPNPNGFYIDGPVLGIKQRSFVGLHPVPIVHGLTNAEYALMINGEGWLKDSIKCNLNVILCEGYTHRDYYRLPVPPSPNLKDMLSVYLYPTLCLFEGTIISIGRGTGFPFEVYGHPLFKDTAFSFTPHSIPGNSNNPLYKDRKCYGRDLRNISEDSIVKLKRINLQWVIDACKEVPDSMDFFNSFFNRLAGNISLMSMLKKGWTEEKIRKTWKPGLEEYMKKRKKYLLYPDFR
jgi:uncharacterized protein YbbC (DUF1343 family)